MTVCRKCNAEGHGNFCANCGASYATGKGAGGGGGGVTLIVLVAGIGLVGIVIIIGIIAAIAIPNLLNAIQRGKQKRTMGDMRAVATAVEAYRDAQGSVPASDGIAEVDQLRPLLEPTYAQNLPAQDAWMSPLLYESDGDSYRLTSLGKDLSADSPAPVGPTTNFASDIVFETGSFFAYPAGSQY